MVFKKGHNPWNKDLKGIHLSPSSEFKKGMKFWLGKKRPNISGINHPLYRKHPTRETIKKNRLWHLGKVPWNKGMKNIYHFKDSGRKGMKLSEECKRKLRIKTREWWNNPKNKELIERRLANILKGLELRPTSFERKIIDLISEYNLPYKYVGNGKVWIARKNPDFINTNGEKKLIETYCRYWHPKNYEEIRSNLFAKYGFKTIFLNEDDLIRNDWKEHCHKKIDGDS